MKWNKILIVAGVAALCILVPYSKGWVSFPSEEEENGGVANNGGDNDWHFTPPYWVEDSESWKEMVANRGLHTKINGVADLSESRSAEVYMEIETVLVDASNVTLYIESCDLPINIFVPRSASYVTSWELARNIYNETWYYRQIEFVLVPLYYDGKLYNYSLGTIRYDSIYTQTIIIQKIGEFEGWHNITICVGYTPIDRTIPKEWRVDTIEIASTDIEVRYE